MRQLIVIFELRDSNPNRLAYFNDMIRKYKSFAFITSGSCIIWTDETAVSVRDNLKLSLSLGDKIFVGEIKAPAAWVTSVPQEVTDYLQRNLK